jgi:hypothetical protein
MKRKLSKDVTERNKRARRACIAISVQKTRAVTFWPLENSLVRRDDLPFLYNFSLSLCVCVSPQTSYGAVLDERDRERIPRLNDLEISEKRIGTRREKKETSL